MSLADEILKLAELKETGLLSEAEFEAAKKKVLHGGNLSGAGPGSPSNRLPLDPPLQAVDQSVSVQSSPKETSKSRLGGGLVEGPQAESVDTVGRERSVLPDWVIDYSPYIALFAGLSLFIVFALIVDYMLRYFGEKIGLTAFGMLGLICIVLSPFWAIIKLVSYLRARQNE